MVGRDYAHLASKWFIIKPRHKVITDMPRSCPSHCGSILSAFPSISKTTKLVRVAPYPSPRVRKNLGGHAVNWRLIKICVSKGFLEEPRTYNSLCPSSLSGHECPPRDMNSSTFHTSSNARKTPTCKYTRNRLLLVKVFSLLYTYPNSMKNEPGFKQKIPWPIYPRISRLKFPAMSVYHHSLNGRTHMHP